MSRTALIAFVVTVLLSEVAGEVPPLSRFTMYAALDPSRTTAVLQLRVDDSVRDPSTLADVSGEALLDVPWPDHVPCTMRWYRDEVRAYFASHRSRRGDGPLVVHWGYVLVGWDGGMVRPRGEFVSLAHGRAWPHD